MAEKKETKLKETMTTKEIKLKEDKKVKGVEVNESELEETESFDEEVSTPKAQENFVYIGKKGAMAYVLAVVTQFDMGATKVIVKARGKSISRAVDVAEIVRNRDKTFKVDKISIATEDVITQEGRPLKISSIEIVLTK